MANSEKIIGMVAEMTQKATYWSCKLRSEGKNLTFNTKVDPGKGATNAEYGTVIEAFKPGDVVEIEYNRSVVPGRFDDKGKPIEMKWIRNLIQKKTEQFIGAIQTINAGQMELDMFQMIQEMHAVICADKDDKYENLSKKDDVFVQPTEEIDVEDMPF